MDLKKELRIIVRYILPPEDRHNDVVESYVDTLALINEEYVKQLSIPLVIKRIREYATDKIDLPEFDLTKKGDYIYCVEWGEKKAKRNEYLVYQKLLKELKEKYVL